MKKQESIYFHRIKHNILGGFSMGLLGKSKKEIEQELKEREFEERYGISTNKAKLVKDELIRNYSTDNVDAILKLKAPSLYNTLADIFKTTMYNKEKIDTIEKKYDTLLDAVNKQNELLSILLHNQITPNHIHNSRI